MRILSWVQNKLSGKQEKKRFDVGSCSSRRTSIPDDRKEEFSDWPQSLLAIGTLGNTDLSEEAQRPNSSEDSHSSKELDFSLEEVIKLQKELTKLLSRKPKSSVDGSETGGERANLPLNRFLNCPSSLEVDRRDCAKFSDDQESGENNGDLSPDSRIILSKAKDILADKRNAIKQKSLSFLLKKMFVCSSGFTPAPSLRDQLSETKMEKLVRILLQKKIHPQSSAAIFAKKYLETKSVGKLEYKDKAQEKEEDGSKWVKTDSDFIVLEI
ncbi:uncharacterized protein LOC109844317 [Asparagus officinalis]|uniref:uncharacterized protein LOC109844317 n=1 Tax=Asparagus officinalis TaxID=4686 RepID=UPI00098E3A4D|nr:uncharacterized protein LOC109844317 [Asparagus officinalis]XP_020268895.1 uncharacterized protein LOC109844317 [Asparagus officinalis]